MADERVRREVVVPHVVGLGFQAAQLLAVDAGVALAQPNPDGPPVGALMWNTDRVITRQDPDAGSVLSEWDSLTVWFDEPRGADPVDEPPAPHPLRAESIPDATTVHGLGSSSSSPTEPTTPVRGRPER